MNIIHMSFIFKQRLFGTQFHPECDRETGNKRYLKDRELLEKHRYNVDEMIKQGPSLEAGVLLSYLSWFKKTIPSQYCQRNTAKYQ